jgi:hypothetical protein
MLTLLLADSRHPDDIGNMFLQNVGPHSIAFQMMAFFIVTVAKTSNLIEISQLLYPGPYWQLATHRHNSTQLPRQLWLHGLCMAHTENTVPTSFFLLQLQVVIMNTYKHVE